MYVPVQLDGSYSVLSPGVLADTLYSAEYKYNTTTQ